MTTFIFNGQKQSIDTNENLGAFSGYIRRPTSSSAGMTAQIFGEDGPDADTITALSLTKFKDLKVYVNVFLIKDETGMPIKKNGEHPKICSFIARIRRSTPKQDGMLANLFAENGPDSDEVGLLSRSEYQNCFVFVSIHGIKAVGEAANINLQAQEKIKNEYVNRLSKVERQEIEAADRKYAKKNELLTSAYLTKLPVLQALGDDNDYKQWLVTQHCCYRQEELLDSCLEDRRAIEVDGLIPPYNYLPICKHHAPEMMDPQHTMDDKNKLFYSMRSRHLMTEWARKKIKERFTEPGHKEPNPALVLEWAAVQGIGQHLPAKYVEVAK